MHVGLCWTVESQAGADALVGLNLGHLPECSLLCIPMKSDISFTLFLHKACILLHSANVAFLTCPLLQDVILVLDTSGSMTTQNRMGIMKQAGDWPTGSWHSHNVDEQLMCGK